MKKGIVIMLCFMGIFSLFGCKIDRPGIKGDNGVGRKGKDNDSGVCSFAYHYNGSIGANSYSFRIEKEEEGFKAYYEAMEYADYEEMETPVEEALLEKLHELYSKHKVYQWDGYNKYATDVLDGWGFSLSYGFNDDQNMSAHGSNATPEGYRDYEKEMLEVIRPVMEKMREEAKRKLIEKGVSGDCQSAYLYFLQKGDSGSDSYTIHIYPFIREGNNNFNVEVKSVSGDIWPEGEYGYSWDETDESRMALDKIDELVRKYDLVNWMYYDEAAEDYNNAEWFQLNIEYQEGRITAMGTKHPEHYEEFRREVLEMMRDHLEKLQDTDDEKYVRYK